SFIHPIRIEIEPADVAFIDAPDRPYQFAVAFSDVQSWGQFDLAHQRVHVLAGVHSFDYFVVDILDGIAVAGEPPVDLLVTLDGTPVARKNDLRLEPQNRVERVDIVQCPARVGPA